MSPSVTPRRPSSPDYLLVLSQRLQVVRSDKDTHFTGQLTKNQSEAEDLTGLLSDRIIITRITVTAKQALHFRLSFYTKSAGTDADLDQDSFVEAVEVLL